MKRRLLLAVLAMMMAAAMILTGCGSRSADSGSSGGQADSAVTDDDADDVHDDDADDADDDTDDADDADDNDADDADEADDDDYAAGDILEGDSDWTKAASGEEAAKAAGLSFFEIPEGTSISLGKLDHVTYYYEDNEAQARIDFPASQVRVTKELGKDVDDLDDYKYTWEQNIKGLVVRCGGNRKGDAQKTVWTVDNESWEIRAIGLGGDDDFGLSADDINSLINGIQ